MPAVRAMACCCLVVALVAKIALVLEQWREGEVLFSERAKVRRCFPGKLLPPRVLSLVTPALTPTWANIGELP
jgi:hypothetical protein